MTAAVLSFEHCRRPSEYYRYQRYYAEGFRQTAGVSLSIVPRSASVFVKARECGVRGISKAYDALSRRLRGGVHVSSDHAGRYVLTEAGRTTRFVIDAHDSRDIVDPAGCDWADMYFKSNFWPSEAYHGNVRPIVNGNGFLDAGKIAMLKELRSAERNLDLVFISRVWAGKGAEYWGGIEHQVRLFETLAALQCTKKLLAIFPDQYRGAAFAPYLARLERAGVRHLHGLYPFAKLCRDLAAARIVFMRSGKHGCIPWRMIDLLCLGCCVAFDSQPGPRWPEPLRPGDNFIECGFSPASRGQVRESCEYAALQGTIGSILRDTGLQERIRQSNREYFDQHASQESVAAYVLASLRETMAPR